MNLLRLLPLLAAGAAVLAQTPGALRVEVDPPDFVFRYTPRVRIPDQPALALALSGGGSRGISHVGVLQRLEEEGYPIQGIAGTSAGALAGTLWACGFSARDIEALFRRVDLSRAFLDPLQRQPGESLSEQEDEGTGLLGLELHGNRLAFAQGLRSGVEVQRTLEGLLARADYFSERDFDRLRVPLRILATNLETGQGVAFGKGSLTEALRASMSVPGAFRPVIIQGQQYVDGALAENIPVRHAKAHFQAPVVLAVDASSPFSEGPGSNFFSITAKSLDLMLEHQQTESRAAADLLIRPRIPDLPFLDYQGQVPLLVEAGKAAFDERRDSLNRLLRRTWGPDEVLPARSWAWASPAEVPPEVQELARALLPPGTPLTRQGVLIFLQQVLARGWVAEAWAEPRGESLELQITPQPPIRALVLEAPPALAPRLRAAFEGAFHPGEVFNPAAFGAFLGSWVNALVLEGAPLVDVRGSGFEPATGHLRLRLVEPRVGGLDVRPPLRGRTDLGSLTDLFRDFMGQPLRPRLLRQRVELAQQRFQLEELRVELRPLQDRPDQVDLVLVPVPRQLRSLEVGLGYESTLGGLVGLRLRTRNLGLKGYELEASGAKNRLQTQGSMALRGPFPGLPGAALEAEADYFEQRIDTPLILPAPELGENSLGARVGASTLRLQTSLRFGNLDQGLARLGLERRDAATHTPEGERQSRAEDAGFLLGEWDNFDRHTLPREGLMLRLRLAAGRELGREAPSEFREAYLRARGLQPLGPRMGLDLDAEWGYGRRLPLDRWWTLGGPSFLVGTKALGFMAPNFLALRLGLPIHVQGPLGTSLDLVPRLDRGWVSAEAPDLTRSASPQARGVGLLLRTTLSGFHVELAYGFAATRLPSQDWGRTHGTFNVRVGMQPFDLWKRR